MSHPPGKAKYPCTTDSNGAVTVTLTIFEAMVVRRLLLMAVAKWEIADLQRRDAANRARIKLVAATPRPERILRR